ncbi:hypothetical protein PGN35_007890 [Nodosilinea sp. PGN35]|uniref:hypothetical protein n=1 Tax=Nodosilinea sp. PGN35 TaxID=3020489 RepID=UPI00398B1A18
MENILLTSTQEELLSSLVEAERQQPPDHRERFTLVEVMISSPSVQHPGLPQKSITVFTPDLETLAEEGLIRFSSTRQRGFAPFTITPLGFKYYEYLKTRSGEPIQRLVSEIKKYLDAETFQARYPAAYQKWSESENLLWGADSEQQLTVIGHLCREAMQEFAYTLICHYSPPNVDTNKARTVSRIRSVMELRKQDLGERKHAFLDALLPYWGTVSDLVQRQEHGAQKEGKHLTWEDGRRVVFHTMVVMFEIDNMLNQS